MWEGTVSLFRFQHTDIVLVGEGACGTEAMTSASAVEALIFVMTRREDWEGPALGACSFDLCDFDANLAILAKHPGARIFLAGGIPESSGFMPPSATRFLKAAEHHEIGQIDRRALEERCSAKKLQPTSLHRVAKGERRDAWPLEQIMPQDSIIAEQWRSRKHDEQGKRLRGQDYISEKRADAAIRPQLLSKNQKSLWISSGTENPFDTAFVDVELIRAYADAGVTDIVIDSDILLLEITRLGDLCRERKLRIYDSSLGL